MDFGGLFVELLGGFRGGVFWLVVFRVKALEINRRSDDDGFSMIIAVNLLGSVS